MDRREREEIRENAKKLLKVAEAAKAFVKENARWKSLDETFREGVPLAEEKRREWKIAVARHILKKLALEEILTNAVKEL